MDRMSFTEFADAREEQELRLIDVREQDEYDDVHVKDAEHFALSWIREGRLPVDDGRRVALICRSGGRSAMAAQILERAGFSQVINVEGGTLAAVAAGEEYVER
jgi:rhodanese-related sulfurtransferase